MTLDKVREIRLFSRIIVMLTCPEKPEATKLLILGAGASCCAGYPPASGMIGELKKFLPDSHADENQKDKCAKLLADSEKLELTTIDSYARYRFDNQKDKAKEYTRDINWLKILTADYFHSKQVTAPSAWRSLVREICGNDVSKTEWRVMSYNFDTLFEQVLHDITQNVGPDVAISNNSQPKNKIEILQKYLYPLHKMHGTFDWTSCIPGNGMERTDPIQEWSFNKMGKDVVSEPLIVFPWEAEKDYHPYSKEWCIMIDEKAEKWLPNVEIIRVIGYSLPEYNEPRFSQLISKCEQRCKLVSLVDTSERSALKWREFVCRNLPGAEFIHIKNKFEDVY